MISTLRYHFRDYLHTEKSEKTIVLFSKSLYFFLIVKIIFLWSVIHDLASYTAFQFITSAWSSVVYEPVYLAQWNLDVFLLAFLLLLVVALQGRLNYFTSALIFWLSLCLSRITGSLANGSDSVLNLFLLLTIGYSYWPFFRPASPGSSRILISNFVLLLCRIQLVLIYFLSGFNKLASESWRSGEAIYSILNLEYISNPTLVFSFNESACATLAWGVILFELGFPFLIWFKQFRIPILCMGVCLNLGIVFMLSLPDFGSVMILAYLLFLPRKYSIFGNP